MHRVAKKLGCWSVGGSKSRSMYRRRDTSRTLRGYLFGVSKPGHIHIRIYTHIHGWNVKILPVLLLSMIIPRHRQKERTFDESTRTIFASMTGKGSSLLLLKSAIYSGYSGSIRSLKERGSSGTQKNRFLISWSIASRAYSTATYCSIFAFEGVAWGFRLQARISPRGFT